MSARASSAISDVVARHRSYRMALVKRLLSRHDVSAVEAVVDRRALLQVRDLRGDLGHVVSGNDGLHAGQRKRLCCVDCPYPRVRVRTAKYLAVKHARGVNVGAVPSHAGHLVQSVVANGTGAYYLEFFI